jgi:hypothetical protein
MAMTLKWKFFVGACILAVGLLLKAGAPLFPIALGLVLAGVVTWKFDRGTTRSPR